MRRISINIILLLLATLGCSPLYAKLQGQALIDSLLKELPKQKEDTNKLKLLKALSKDYQAIGKSDHEIKYLRQGLELANNLNLKIEKGVILVQIGTHYCDKSDFPKALEYYLEAMRIFEQLNYANGVAAASSNITIVYNRNKDYAKALEYGFKALKYEEVLRDTFDIETSMMNIGDLYLKMEDFPKALEYDFRAIKLAEAMGDIEGMAMVNANIGSIYHNIKLYAKAIEYTHKSLKQFEELGNKKGVAGCLCNIGLSYFYIVNDTVKKKKSLYDSVAVVERECLPDSVSATPNVTIPKSRKELLTRGIDSMQKALAICKEINDLDFMQDCYSGLSDAYKLKGDYKQAMEYQSNYRAIKDSIFSAKNNKSIMEQGVKYEYEKKEAVAKAVSAKEIQKQKLMRNGFMGGFAVVLLFAGIFFSQRNKIKAGKKQSDELLLNILPAEVAEELKAKGSAEAKLIDDVTVLFTDFKGFTQLSEKLTAKELVSEINTCFSAFDNIMQKHGVEKIKTIGDAYMAAGGLPTPNKTHAEDVVKAALEIQAFMHRHKEEREAEGRLFFEIRIGVHTGPVVAGIVGIKKFAYDIWGDTVNTASRMESSGTVGKVNISQTTYELVKDKFSCEYRGEVEAKGKGMMKMYYVG